MLHLSTRIGIRRILLPNPYPSRQELLANSNLNETAIGSMHQTGKEVNKSECIQP